MTDEAKALVERSETIRSQMYLDLVANDTQHKEMLALIKTQAREIERLRGLLREAEIKLTDVQGAYATKQYSANLLTRIRAALGDSHD